MDLSSPKVGFFDSGIGGLTTLESCVRYAKENLSAEKFPRFFYYGDNGRAPYGNLPPERIEKYVCEALDVFEKTGVSAVVLACNTATAVCVENLRKKYAFSIVGTEPAIFSAARKGGDVFALCTRATFNSPRFNSLCVRARKKYPAASIFPFACDGLAGAIETNLFDGKFDFSKYLPSGRPTSVVLGCTHYVYIREKIEKFYGAPTYDGNEGIARRLFSVLEKNSPKKEEKNVDNKKNRFSQPLATTLQKGEEIPEIFFLGEGKMVNKTKYEQMFAVKTGKNGR